MPDLSDVFREAFPLGPLGPAVRRWWPITLTAAVAALTVWAATATWFGLTIGRTAVPFGFTGTGRIVRTGPDAKTIGFGGSDAVADGVISWGYATAGLAIAALIAVIVATLRPGFTRGLAVASGLLGVAAVLSIAIWLIPAMMMGGLEDLAGGEGGGDPLFFPPKAGLVWTIVLTSVGAAVLFMGRRNRPRSDVARRG